MDFIMASAEHLLISKVINDNDISHVVEAGIRPNHFSPQWEGVWLWVLDYWRTHAAIPSIRALNQEFADLELADSGREQFSNLIDEVLNSYRHQKLVETISSAMPLLNNNSTNEAIQMLSDGLQTASAEVARLRDVDLIQSWEERIARYNLMRETPNAIRGIPTGFTGLDRITAGLRPQQLITFVGEAKKGKSLITLIIANAVHTHGKVPMFISFEMSIEEQAARYDAIVSNISHTKIIRGDLTKKEVEKIEKTLSMRKNMHPFLMSEDSSSLTTVSAIAGKIQQHRPDMLIVDGVYLMDDEQGEPKGSPQALTNITRSLKRIAQRFDIPIIGTTQVLGWKLGNKKSRKITADSIGYTSSFSQDSDLVIGVESDPDIDNQAILRVVLARSAPMGEVKIKWDWENMDFSEVFEDESGDSDDWYY
jgi:replicative DNA helicase